MIGTRILLNGEGAFGRRLEGTITDTSKPGTCMEMVPATAMKNGRLSWRAWSATTGDPRMVVVLLEDDFQGKLWSDAYIANTQCKLYVPLPGDELNMLIKDISGTGDTHAIGDRMVIDSASGKLIVQPTSANAAQFQLEEAEAAPTADSWLACFRT